MASDLALNSGAAVEMCEGRTAGWKARLLPLVLAAHVLWAALKGLAAARMTTKYREPVVGRSQEIRRGREQETRGGS